MDYNEKEHLWVEKYRPQTIKDCILPDRIKKDFDDALTKGKIPNMLFYGTAGTGKTTVAKALCNELDVDWMLINASEENGIDTIRNKVQDYASTMSFSGGGKVILMDECLEENEKVRVGTVDNWNPIPLNHLERDVDYPIVSFNMNTKEYENDTGRIISDKQDDIYEVELEDGRKVLVNGKHPFIVNDDGGQIIEMSINDGLKEGVDVVVMD